MTSRKFASRPTRVSEWVTVALAAGLARQTASEILQAVELHEIRTRVTTIGKAQFLLIDRAEILAHFALQEA